jgi:ankyrin repeat protein
MQVGHNRKSNIVKYAGGGQLDTVNLLLAAGANIDTIAKPGPKTEAMTALLFAIQEDENEMVRFLIDRGADVNLSDRNGLTPLAAAAGKGDFDIFTILLAEGADPGISDKKGRTPLMAAVENGNVKIINALLAEGLDPNYADPKGNTLLHAAIKEGNTDAFKVLLESGADPHAANMDGRTPLYYAAVFKADAEVFEALLDAGADPNALDEGGRTILDIVVMVGRAEGVREVLIAHGATRPVRKPLLELWVLIFILALLPLPYYFLHSLRYQYCRREEEDGVFYFEIRWEGDILRRRIQVIPGRPPIRETMAQQATLKETAGLIPCSAREFYRHWRRRNIAYLLFNLHLRLCVLAVLFSTLALVVSAEEQARRYARFSPLFSFMKFLEDFFYNPDDWLIGAIIGAPLVAGALVLIVLLIFQFMKPPFRQRVTAIIIGVAAGLISIGCGLYYIALAASGL